VISSHYANAYAYADHIEVLRHGAVVAHLPVPTNWQYEQRSAGTAGLTASLLSAGWHHNTWHGAGRESLGCTPQWLLTSFVWKDTP
jgi:hypothetical protein